MASVASFRGSFRSCSGGSGSFLVTWHLCTVVAAATSHATALGSPSITQTLDAATHAPGWNLFQLEGALFGQGEALPEAGASGDKQPPSEDLNSDMMRGKELLGKGVSRLWRGRRRAMKEGRDVLGDGKCFSPNVEPRELITFHAAQPDNPKFLLLMCRGGQISNRVLCIVNHILVAGLLNRTLVVPAWLPWEGDPEFFREYDLRTMWDLNHTRRCLGENAVISTEEYIQKWQEPLPGSAPQPAPSADPRKELLEEDAASLGPEGAPGDALTPEPEAEDDGAEFIRIDHVHCLAGPAGYCSKDYIDPEKCPLEFKHLKAVGNKAQEGNNTGAPPPKQKDSAENEAQRFTLLEISTRKMEVFQPGLQVTTASVRSTTVNAACFSAHPQLKDFLDVYQAPGTPQGDARMLAIGDMQEMFMQDRTWGVFENKKTPVWLPYGGRDPYKRLPGCPDRLLVKPPAPLFTRAHQVIKRLFGNQSYVSFHWRRGDFQEYCRTVYPNGKCIYSPEEAAKCFGNILDKLAITNVFLATNADFAEVAEFKRALANATTKTVVIRQWTRHEEKLTWLREKDLKVNKLFQAHLLTLVLEKLIAAHGTVFVGSVISTFSMDIFRMRVGLAKDTTCDRTLCF